MNAKDLDHKFHVGEDITPYLDLSGARRSALESKKVHVDFPARMNKQQDKEAKGLGLPRQSIIKMWVAERLRKE